MAPETIVLLMATGISIAITLIGLAQSVATMSGLISMLTIWQIQVGWATQHPR
jgi:hypothetical protein